MDRLPSSAARTVLIAATVLAISLTACAAQETPATEAAAGTPPSDTAYCDAVKELAGHQKRVEREMIKGAKKADRAKLRQSVEGLVSASTAARDAAPADLPDSWEPVVRMFEAYRDAAEKLDYNMFSAKADRITEKLPHSDGALDVLSGDAAKRCGIKRWGPAGG